MPTSNVHSGGQKTVRRSFPSRPLRAWNPTGQASPHRQEEFEPAPLPTRHRKPPAAAQESVRAEGHRRTGRSTESGTQPPERGRRLRAPVRPNLPRSGRCPSAYSCVAWHIPSRLDDHDDRRTRLRHFLAVRAGTVARALRPGSARQIGFWQVLRLFARSPCLSRHQAPGQPSRAAAYYQGAPAKSEPPKSRPAMASRRPEIVRLSGIPRSPINCLTA